MTRHINIIARRESGIETCKRCGCNDAHIVYNQTVLCHWCGFREEVDFAKIKVPCIKCKVDKIPLDTKKCPTCGDTVQMLEKPNY